MTQQLTVLAAVVEAQGSLHSTQMSVTRPQRLYCPFLNPVGNRYQLGVHTFVQSNTYG